MSQDILDICYLVLLPYAPTLSGEHKGVLTSPKGAPYFYDTDISVGTFPQKQLSLHGVSVTISVQLLDNVIWVAECRYSIPSPSEKDKALLNGKIQEQLREEFIRVLDKGQQVIFEEYSILLIQEKNAKPDDVIDQHTRLFAEFIRDSYDKPLDRREIKDILSTRVRYSAQDLVVVDWNGAIIITDDGDFQSDIDLLKIGNYQLMRYRMLDATLEEQLEELRKIVQSSSRMFLPGRRRLLQNIINQRLQLLLNFEKLDQSLLLIGDWYSSQLYEGIVNEFYLGEWKTVVQNKLESLRSIHEVVTQNLTISWNQVIEFITFIGWFLMMIGYFILFYFDFRYR